MKTRMLLFLVVALFGSITLSPATALEGVPDPSAETVVSTTVPLFGTSLVVTVVSDANGNFVRSELTAADPALTDVVAGFSQEARTDGTQFAIEFENHDAGIEIELAGNNGQITDLEVEAYEPGAAAGVGQWIGDPLGNGLRALVDYTVTIDDSGVPNITIDAVTRDPSEGDLFWVIEPQVIESHDGEQEVAQPILLNDTAGDFETLLIVVEVEHGESEVKVMLGNKHNDADHDDEDHEDHDEDHGEDENHDEDHDEDEDDSEDDSEDEDDD